MPEEFIIHPLDLPVSLWEQAHVFLESVAGGHLKARLKSSSPLLSLTVQPTLPLASLS